MSVSGTLYVVATPIGNLEDIGARALRVLREVALIAAEDTRHSARLLQHFGIATPLVACHEHNERDQGGRLVGRLLAGEDLALISDAGTPLISDPGYKLVEEAARQGAAVTTIPGPSAVLAALVVAGLPTDRFFFEGFLPPRTAARRSRLTELAAIPGTLVFFESPRRLAEMLADAAAMLGPRPAAVARELTKLHETVRRGALPDLAAAYAAGETARGEIVVLIGPGTGADAPAASGDLMDGKLKAALSALSLKEAVAQVAAETGQPRRKVYARALELTRRP